MSLLSTVIFAADTSEHLKITVLQVLAELPAADLEMIQRRRVLVQERDLAGMYSHLEPELDRMAAHDLVINIDPATLKGDEALKVAVALELAAARLNHHETIRRYSVLAGYGAPVPEESQAATLAMHQRAAAKLVKEWGFDLQALLQTSPGEVG